MADSSRAKEIGSRAKEFGVNFNKMKYDSEMESVVLEWMCGVLGDTECLADVCGHDALKEKLRDGIILCKLMNKIKPGSVKKFNEKPKMPFQKMENIGFFNEAMRGYGVKSEYVFVTEDLYNGKNLAQVLIGLRELGTKATDKGVQPAIRELKKVNK